jgi:hypothetical protein
MTMDLFLLTIIVLLIVPLWLRIKELEWQHKSDSDYVLWWLRSQEERKANKPEVDARDEALLDDEPL